MKIWLALIFCAIISSPLYGENSEYKFRLILKDKGTSNYTLEKPEEFLSIKAIERRQRQNIAISQSDIPISDEYIKQIEAKGGRIVAKSKWLYTVSVHCTDSTMVDSLKTLPFVRDAVFVWKGRNIPSKNSVYPDTLSLISTQEPIFGEYYGWAYQNIKALNADTLHKAGYKGQGMDIAIIDAGFKFLPSIKLLDNANIKGYKGFVDGIDNIFLGGNQHGLNVMSCIAANQPLTFVGTAPEANIWLLNTEDSRSEFPIEEDYWVAAIEYADSLGVDVVNSSLGYSKFDSPAKSYEHKDLTGHTAYISLGAAMAARKGMLVVCSAGNSGDEEWQKITPPSDVDNVLTVGAIRQDSVIARFSSRGMTADLRVKPDVVALGFNSTVIDDKGMITYKSGTSFSSPIMTGVVACLWQAYPELTNKEILNIVRESSNNFQLPNDTYGYGIPNMKIAMQKASTLVEKKIKAKESKTIN